MWELDGIGDLSDLAVHDGRLYVLSDQSRSVVAVDLPLAASATKAVADEVWDLDLSKRLKPEGLEILPDGTFIVGIDTRKPEKNLYWFRP